MTPREALTKVRAFVNGTANVPGVGEALTVLDRLVSKDEADRKFMQRPTINTPSTPRCTCGQPALGPCAVWGHS